MRFLLPIAVAALLVTGLARADTAAYQAQQLAKYEKFAGAPVNEFPMFSLWQWQIVGPEKVVVWPTVNTAYMLTVDKPCSRLQWTNALGVTQTQSMKVSTRFDFVTFEHQRCRIVEIQPIDYKAMRKDDAAAAAQRKQSK